MNASLHDAGARPDEGSAPARIGRDLGPRVAAAVVMGVAALAVAWIGGLPFAAFWWILSVVVLWEWQRIVSRELLIARVAAGALVLAVAALFALHNHALVSVLALVAAAAAVAYVGGPERRLWTGGGALYAGAPEKFAEIFAGLVETR